MPMDFGMSLDLGGLWWQIGLRPPQAMSARRACQFLSSSLQSAQSGPGLHASSDHAAGSARILDRNSGTLVSFIRASLSTRGSKARPSCRSALCFFTNMTVMRT